MENKHSEPLEGTVTILAKHNSDTKDSGSRTAGKHAMKPQKAAARLRMMKMLTSL